MPVDNSSTPARSRTGRCRGNRFRGGEGPDHGRGVGRSPNAVAEGEMGAGGRARLRGQRRSDVLLDASNLQRVDFQLRAVTDIGAIAAHGRTSGPGSGPPVVIWLTSARAEQAARDQAPADAVIGEPVYVHDGPPGREAWRWTSILGSADDPAGRAGGPRVGAPGVGR